MQNKQSLLLRNQIPKNWQKVKLGDIAVVNMGQSPSSAFYNAQGEGLPFYQGVTDFGEKYPTPSMYCSQPAKTAESGTTLFSVRAPVGEVNIANEEVCIGRGVASLSMKNGNNEFLYPLLKSQVGYFKAVSGGTTYESINKDQIEDIEVVVPIDLEDQKKLASVLSAFDDKIEVNNKIAKTLEEMAQALFKEWFALPSVALAKEGKLPEGWEIKKVKDFGLVVTGKTPSKEKSEYYGDYMPFIKTPDMHGNTFCIKAGESLSEAGTNLQKNKILPANSICVSCIGTAGVVTITTQASQTNQQINSVILKDQVDREFLFFVLRGLENTINMYGANGVTMVNLNKSKFESLQIIYPSADLVNSFHTIVYPMFELIKNLQFKNRSLYQTRDLLLPKLMKGEIRV